MSTLDGRNVEKDTGRTSWVLAYTLGGVLVLAGALRIAGWWNWSLWLDEAIQFEQARGSLGHLFRALFDQAINSPLDYLCTWLVLRLSNTDAALRALPVVWSLGAALLVFVRMGGARRALPSLAATFTFAVLPIAVHYGQEVRPYSLALFLVAAADAARRPLAGRVPGRPLAFLIFSAAAPYAHPFALFPIGGLWLAEVWANWRDRRDTPLPRRPFLFLPLIALLLFTPWLAVMRRGASRPAEIPAPRFNGTLALDYSVGFLTDRDPSHRHPIGAAFMAGLIIGGLLAMEGRERRETLILLAATTACPLAALSAAGHWWDPRYIIFAVLPVCRAAGEAIAAIEWRLPGPAKRLGLVVLVAAILAIEAPALVQNVHGGRPDWRPVARFMSDQAGTGRSGVILAVDAWAGNTLRAQTLRQSPPVETQIVDETAALARAMKTAREGWLIRSPAYPAPREMEAFLRVAEPMRVFPDAEGARLYRFENGELPLEETHRMEFEPLSTGRAILGGWSGWEASGLDHVTFAWATGRTADVVLVFLAPADRVLRFRAWPFVWEGSPPQTLDVSLNQEPIGHLVLSPDASVYEIALPAKLTRRGGNILHLGFAYAESPKRHDPHSRDGRPLAVAFDWLTVEHAAPPKASSSFEPR